MVLLVKKSLFKIEKYGSSQKVRRHTIVWRNSNCYTKPDATNAFVLGYHVYKKSLTPIIGDQLQGFMEPTNKLYKYAVTVKGKDRDLIGHFPLGKSGTFAKTVFYFLKSDKNHHCKIMTKTIIVK